jgi:DNA-binding NtrC family response regulator
VIDKMLSGRRILAVEDDMLIRLTLEDMLGELGCASVSTAGTIDQALRLIDVRVFDAATLDVNLGGVSSYAVADALTARGVPFVFTTGYGAHFLSDGYRERPLLKKPFACNDLGYMLMRLLS